MRFRAEKLLVYDVIERRCTAAGKGAFQCLREILRQKKKIPVGDRAVDTPEDETDQKGKKEIEFFGYSYTLTSMSLS